MTETRRRSGLASSRNQTHLVREGGEGHLRELLLNNQQWRLGTPAAVGAPFWILTFGP